MVPGGGNKTITPKFRAWKAGDDSPELSNLLYSVIHPLETQVIIFRLYSDL